MSEKELLQQQYDKDQAVLDQAWATMATNLTTLKQIYSLIDASGVVGQYIGLILVQTTQNILKQRIEEMP